LLISQFESQIQIKSISVEGQHIVLSSSTQWLRMRTDMTLYLR